jgi:hypothetical protein
MMKTIYLGQRKIQLNYQAIFWYMFSMENIDPEIEESWLIEFVHSDIFKQMIRPESTRPAGPESYPTLESAFHLSHLAQTNLRTVNKEQLNRFFREYAESNDWGDDRAEFIAIMNEFFDVLETRQENKFFFISKEWFNKGDRILSEDSDIYLYYFIIIWINMDDKIVNVCEWSYD